MGEPKADAALDGAPAPVLTARQEIWRGLLYGQRSMMLRLGGRLKEEFGLTVAQFEALLTLWETPGRRLPTTALSRTLLYSSGSTTHLVARLVESGWVERAPDPGDARVQLVNLTERGRGLIERAVAAHVEDLAACFDPLIEDADVDVLLAFARRLAEAEQVSSQPPAGAGEGSIGAD